MLPVDFITNLAPHYRKRLWLRLLRCQSYKVRFVFGENPKSSIRQIDFGAVDWHDLTDRLSRVHNIRIRRTLVWQRGVVSRAAFTDAEIAVILGDMNVLSNWIAALVLRARRKKVVFWGHGLTGREARVTRFFRLSFLRLADWNLVYGERAKKLLVKYRLPEPRISVIFNSLDYERQKSLRSLSVDPSFYRKSGWFQHGDLPVLIFIGRLTGQKNLKQLVEAVIALNAEVPRVNVIFVGDGPEKQMLERKSDLCQEHIHFFGPCYEEEVLAKLIANADLCVSPGAVGLTAIHCLSYGTPVCTHGNFSEQAPEVEAIVDGETGVFFDQTSQGLRLAIDSWIDRKNGREELRKKCYLRIDEDFNPRNQCRIFDEVFSALERTV